VTPPTASIALQLGRDALLQMQHPDGWWKGVLDTNVTMDAEDLLLRHVLGVLDPADASATANWIRSQQRDDGTWATFYGGPGDLSTTIEAYVGLRLAGDPADAAHLEKARAFVLEQGGIERSRVFTRIWLALCGSWSWDRLPALPPEVMLLPSWFPLNIYDFACWARQTIVPLTVVWSARLVRPLPFTVDELCTGASAPSGRPTLRTVPGRLAALDALLRRYERHHIRTLRRVALARAERWIARRQEADGSWGGIQPPWVYSMMALHALGYPLDHPALRAGFAGLERFTVREGDTRRLEACQSPVWDTALAAIALADAGVPGDDPALGRACQWLLDREIDGCGDWAVRRPRLAPGGWAFEFANLNYPDVDDTAEVMLALHRAAGADHRDAARRAIDRGAAWIAGMQCGDGGWAAFDVDNTRTLCRQFPFCDFGEVIDPPSADVTAHVVEAFAALRAGGDAVEQGVAWLSRYQEEDGSWFGRWGANHVYGTGAVVPALITAGVPPDDFRVRRAVAWLVEHQNDDGGWGEDLRSYRDPAWIGRGQSTPSQTAWALLALLAAGHCSAPVDRGVAYLVNGQRADGTWDEPQYTGTGFPGDFYINYGLYRQVFPVMALGRYVGGGPCP
jgi:squalene-hopene/tetraprenyl-beta-curcumene cyclase